MKPIYLILFGALLLTGCKKGDSQDPNNILGGVNDGNIVLPGTLASDGVEIWIKEDQIIADDYYSQIDTAIQSESIVRSIKYALGQTESGAVAWTIDGKSYAGTELPNAKTWDGNIQKWTITNTCVFDISNIKSNLKIEAVVNISGKSVKRLKTIPIVTINKHISDAFGFTIGTKRQDMIVSADYSPTLARKDSTLFTAYLEFSNGQLSGIDLTTNNFGAMSNLVSRCRIPTIPIFSYTNGCTTGSYNMIFNNPQEWNKGSLNIKTQNLDFGYFTKGVNSGCVYVFLLSIKKKS